MKLNLTCKISGCSLNVQYSTFYDEWWVDQVTISDDQRHIFGLNSKLKLLNPLKRDRFTGWAQLEEGLSVCRTRCTGSFLAGRSINRNGAPSFKPGQAPESAIKKQRSQGLHKPQWGSLEKASNCRKIQLLCHDGSLSWFWVTNFSFGSLTSDAGRLTWHWKPIRKIYFLIAFFAGQGLQWWSPCLSWPSKVALFLVPCMPFMASSGLTDLQDLLHSRVTTQFVHAVLRAKEKQRPLISRKFWQAFETRRRCIINLETLGGYFKEAATAILVTNRSTKIFPLVGIVQRY